MKRKDKILNKFINEKELAKAYQELEREYTIKCQELNKLNRKLEISDKDREQIELENIARKVILENPKIVYIPDLATLISKEIIKAGYGRVDESRKEIETGDIPVNSKSLGEAIDKVSKLEKENYLLKAELDNKKDLIKNLENKVKMLKGLKFRQYVAVDSKGNIIDYAIFEGEKSYPLKDYIDMVKKQAIEEFYKSIDELIENSDNIENIKYKIYDFLRAINMLYLIKE